MASKRRTRVKEIFFDGKINIIWQDGAHSKYNYFDLRCACPCAKCVDEITGRKILEDSNVDPKVHPKESAYVGNYALSITWSDGHSTGLYRFQSLRDSFPKDSEEMTS